MINFALDAAMPGAEAYAPYILLIVMIVIFYLMLIRPQKKREKADRDMRESIVPGDRIISIGGFIGKVVQVGEEDVVIESGGNRLKMMKWAIREKVEKVSEKD